MTFEAAELCTMPIKMKLPIKLYPVSSCSKKVERMPYAQKVVGSSPLYFSISQHCVLNARPQASA